MIELPGRTGVAQVRPGARPAGQRTARNTDTTLLRDYEVAVATRNRDDRASTATFPRLDAYSDVVEDRSRKSTKNIFSLP